MIELALRMLVCLAAVFLVVAALSTFRHWHYSHLAGARHLAEAVTIAAAPWPFLYWSTCDELLH